MAIHSPDMYTNKNLKSVYSTNSKGRNITECRILTFNMSSNGGLDIPPPIIKHPKGKSTKNILPHIASDKLHLLSHLTEAKLYKKTYFVSSYPLGANIYKASSDEFKLKNGKKNKKSVLTLPNEPSILPNSCTASDMNDSEYLQRNTDKVKVDKPKKRIVPRSNQQKRINNYEFYDRDAKYCSQVNIDLDCSSTDMIKNFKGDCKKNSNLDDLKLKNDEEVQPHDVWAVLRNINRFKFHPSPPISDNSMVLSPRKKKATKKNKRKTGVFESRTEQYAYISSFGVNNRSQTCLSDSSSIDRVTVINNQKNINDKCETTQQKPANIRMKTIPNKGKENLNNSPLTEKGPRMNGAAKSILSKGQELALSKKREPSTGKPSIVTTTSSSVPAPKLTKTEIRRRLANIKFPLVILGKDQLSASFKVEPNDSPQFNGLDDHIWPFMHTWSNNTGCLRKQDNKDANNLPKKRNNHSDHSPTNTKKPMNYNKQVCNDKKTVITNVNLPLAKKTESKLLTGNNDINKESQQVIKPKPMRQFRDKMLKLIYKKTFIEEDCESTVNDNLQRLGQGDVKEIACLKERQHGNAIQYDNANTNIDILLTTDVGNQKVNANEQYLNIQVPPSPTLKASKPSKHRRSKAKWASDFIENVIKKVKTGVYYSNDSHEMLKASPNESKEVSVQTTLPLSNIYAPEEFTPKITINNKIQALELLPGFDSVIPQLEIKSMTRNEIAIKNCVTNVLLQFDVTVPLETDLTVVNYKRSTSCIPLSVTDSMTKVFKCKARIFNSMLPAEICSIIPRIMNKLSNPETIIALPLVQENTTCLSTISELSASEAPSLSVIKLPLLPQIMMSPNLRKIVDGKFLRAYEPTSEKSINNGKNWIISLHNIDLPLVLELLPHPRISSQDYFEAHPTSPLTWKPSKLPSEALTITNAKNMIPVTNNLCTDLVPLPSKTVDSSPCLLSKLFRFMQKRMPILNLNPAAVPFFNTEPPSNNLTVNFKIDSPRGIINTVSIEVVHFKTDSLCNSLVKSTPHVCTTKYSESSVKCIEYIKDVNKTKVTKTKNVAPLPTLAISNKHIKRKYVKLYKKCKSTSHISTERTSTPLSKITNLDEFFQAMSTGKILSSAFDGYSGRKILSCVIEMTSWITEITPRQALLLLLLSNKKETPNLMRFRPVILQGIAVNRITRASELDMEIEVIERESFNKFPVSESIPYLPDCVQNDDNLLEELYWIAKTTASDYQKPFDESSENLLKALLEKRKKLNPSYLRVMARYVGLGLLKSPVRKCF